MEFAFRFDIRRFTFRGFFESGTAASLDFGLPAVMQTFLLDLFITIMEWKI